MKHFLCCLFFDCPSPRENTRSEFHTRVFRESAGIFTSRHVCNKLVVSSLLRIDFHKLATAWYQQTCAKLLTSLLQTCCQQPCYSIVTTTSLQVRQQVATSLSQQAGNKQCEHILLTSCWNSIATSLLQACYNLCVFTRVTLTWRRENGVICPCMDMPRHFDAILTLSLTSASSILRWLPTVF